jgi:MoxR-like ATPase
VEIWNEQQRRRERREPEEDDLPVEEERKPDQKWKKKEEVEDDERINPLDTAANRTRSKAVIPGKPVSSSLLPQIDTIWSRVAESVKILQELTKLAGGCSREKLVSTLKSSSKNPA